MNNSIGIIIAAAFFQLSVLILAILSELPWNTLLPAFQYLLRYDRSDPYQQLLKQNAFGNSEGKAFTAEQKQQRLDR